MARKTRVNSRRTRIERFEEEVRQNVTAIVSYEQPKKKFTLHDLEDIGPITDAQEKVFDLWEDDYSLVLTGSAGTGKTMCALYLALKEVLSGRTDYKKVILVRSTVPTRDQGFLKGDINEKEAVYELPFQQICDDIFKKKNQYKYLKESGVVEFVSTSFVRGMTFKNAIVILDEAQSCNYHEISTIVTRLGHYSKLVICGDVIQSDLIYRKSETSGLPKFLEVTRGISEFQGVHFTPDDIVRSGLVKSFLIAEEKFNSRN